MACSSIVCVNNRRRRRAAGVQTAAGGVLSIIFGGALLVASITHADLPKTLPDAAVRLVSILALTACYGFGVSLACKSFERAKSVSYHPLNEALGSKTGRPAEMLRSSARPDLSPAEMLRADTQSALALSEHLVRPHLMQARRDVRVDLMGKGLAAEASNEILGGEDGHLRARCDRG